MTIGHMDKRGQLYKIPITQKPRGGWVEGTPEKVKHIWCSIHPMSGKKLLEHQQQKSRIDTEIRTRYTPEFEDRKAIFVIKYRGHGYRIEHAIDTNSAQKIIKLEAVEEPWQV